MEYNLKHETATETIKAAPAIAGAVYSTITLNEMVALVTIVYILLQAGYLIWKWYRDIRDYRYEVKKRDEATD